MSSDDPSADGYSNAVSGIIFDAIFDDKELAKFHVAHDLLVIDLT